MFSPCRTRFFLLGGHKMDLFAPRGEIKSTLWLASKKIHYYDLQVEKKSYAIQEELFFTCVIVDLALLGHQSSHSQNQLFSPLLHNILL